MSNYAEQFITHLEKLNASDRAAMATLRRSLAFQPGAYPPAYPYVERFIASDRHAEDATRIALYLSAALYALHPRHGPRSLAAGLGQQMYDRASESIEKRFIALLGADADNLADYLRQAVSLLKADELSLDYAALLDDLAVWLNPRADAERRDRIRQRWARDFYRAQSANAHAGHLASEN